jgi:hypothetical protein
VWEQGSHAHFIFDRRVSFRPLVQMICNAGCSLCMITKLMNKWVFTFCKCNCHSVTLCLPYVKLSSYPTKHVQISNGVKLNVADGVHKDLWGLYPRHPWGISRTWAWPSPTWQCPTSTTPIAHQPGATSGHLELPDEEASGEWQASWGWTPATSTPGEGFFVLRFSGNWPASLCVTPQNSKFWNVTKLH